jgi:hypothetical protein
MMPFDTRRKFEKNLVEEYGKKGREVFFAMENLKKHHGKSATRQY